MTYTPFTLEDLYNKYENLYQYNLSSACMPAISLDDLLELYSQEEAEKFKKELFETKLDYSEQFGLKRLREALSNNLYPDLNPDNFLLSTGASEAIFLVMSSLFKAGDSIIVQKPIYQSLYQVAEDRGVRVIDWDLDLEKMNWEISELENLIQSNPDAKALVINNPNNPVGTVFNEEELKRISTLLEDRFLISDEVFLPISLKPSKSAAEVHQYGISISDLSKSFNMPGLRLGWIACSNPKLIQELSSYKNYLSLRNNSLAELAAVYLINKAEEITNKNKELIRSNITKLYSYNPEDLFFDLSQKRDSISNLCFFPKLKQEHDLDHFLKQGYFLALGENFGDKYKAFARIGLGNDACYHFLKCKQ